MSAQVYSVPGQTEGSRKAFFEQTSIDLSSKLSLTYGIMLAIVVVFIILFLFYLWEKGIPLQFSRQIRKLSF